MTSMKVCYKVIPFFIIDDNNDDGSGGGDVVDGSLCVFVCVCVLFLATKRGQRQKLVTSVTANKP